MFRFVPPSDQSNPPGIEAHGAIAANPAPSSEQEPPAPPDDTAVDIVDNVMRAAHRLRGLLNSHLGQFELTDIRYAVLQAIRETASNGCSQKDLSNRLNQTESSISTLIERMRQSGLLYRLPSTVDRRRKVLLLVRTGPRNAGESGGISQPARGGAVDVFQFHRPQRVVSAAQSLGR